MTGIGSSIALATMVIAAAACGSSTTRVLEDGSELRASAETSITVRDTTQQLSTTFTLTNVTVAPIHLEYGACPVRVLAYRTEARNGTPAWNSDYRKPYGQSYVYGCTLQLLASDIAPGHAQSFGFTAPLIEVVGDSLPDGRYYLVAELRLASQPQLLRSAAGSVDISLTHPR